MWKRIKELIIKLLSIKGVFAILFTVLAFMEKSDVWMAFSAWVLFILGREYFKTIIGIKGNQCGDNKG
jgi:hypothetical protein